MRASRSLLVSVSALLACAAGLQAQDGGFLAGSVREPSGLPIPGAQIIIQNEGTGLRQKLSTDASGQYGTNEILAGKYRLIVRSEGFRSVTAFDVAVSQGETRAADFTLKLLPSHQEVTVVSAPESSDPAASGIAVERQNTSAATLPVNGRDLHSLYILLPGAVPTPAGASDGGQFSVAGQRANTNTFRIDGVSANTGVSVSAVPGAVPGSALPGMSVIGSTQAIASREEIERIELRSSDFSPENGDRPGGQVLIETRSGGDQWHGDAFGSLRPKALDSTDWFAKAYKTASPAASASSYGAGAGGPIYKDQTFLFAAIEQTDVHDTAMQIMPVPSLGARAAGTSQSAPLLDAFPAPTGPALGGDEAIATVPFVNTAAVRNYSLRLDHSTGSKTHFFTRFANMPSTATANNLGGSRFSIGSYSVSVGATTQYRGWVHDLRLNYSSANSQAEWLPFPDAVPALDAIATPPINSQESVISGLNQLSSFEGSSNRAIAGLSIQGVGQILYGDPAVQRQQQAEFRYVAARDFGTHALKTGVDFAGIIRSGDAGIPTTSAVAGSISEVLAGDPLGMTFSLGYARNGDLWLPIGSAFAQDTWKVNPRLTVLYGLRWEVPDPRAFASWTGFSAGTWPGVGGKATITGSSGGSYSTGPRPLRLYELAPRMGVAYRLRLGWVLRAGSGMFYDDAIGSLIDPVNLSPFHIWQYLPGVNSSIGEGFPKMTPLWVPEVWESRISIDHQLTSGSTLSLAYVGSDGFHLLREDATMRNPEQLGFVVFESSGHSAYNAFEAQVRGDLTPSLYGLVSYTWSHSIDNGSEDGSLFLSGERFGSATDKGSSNFDVRHDLTASASWQPRFLKGFVLSATLQARTGFPFDVSTVDRSIGLGFANTNRPDLVPDVPAWVPAPGVAGGRRLNPLAFALPPDGTNGNLGRNVLTGPGLIQLDASVRREFRLGERMSLDLSLSSFNVTNASNFASPVGYLGSPLFGMATSMQNLMMGTGTPGGGLTPLYQSGGPRTAEIGLKLSW